MHPYKKLFIMAGIALLASCHNTSTTQKTGEDTSAVEEVDESALARQQVVSAFPSVYQFFSRQDSSFSAGKFIETETDTLQAAPALPVNEKALKPYHPYLIYNPDSTYAIDLYSYNIILVNKNGKIIGKAGGPDTEVGLVDVKNNTRRRIYFGGSSSSVLDAQWLNNGEFLVMTGEIIKDHAFSPTLLKFSIPFNTVQHFIYEDTLRIRPSEYVDKRLPIQ